MKTRLDLRLVQKLVMTPQLQQAIKLLQLSRLELSQTVSQELLENPMLEEGSAAESEDLEAPGLDGKPADEKANNEDTPGDREETDLSAQWEEYISDIQREDRNREYSAPSGEEPPSSEQTLSRPPSLSEHLLWQLRLSSVTPREAEIGQIIIGNIDEDGYLRYSLEEVVAASSAQPEEVEKVLRIIQGFDPMGVGGRDLRECLLIQIRQLDLADSVVETVVTNHLKDIETRRFPVIARAVDISLDEVMKVVKVIQGLEPKPGRPFYLDEAQTIIPDIYVVKSEGDYIVVLNDDGLPKLRISSYYRKLISEKGGVGDATRHYLEDRLRSAVWLVRSIEQRNRTICKVSQSIVKFQRDFMSKGVAHLKPLVLRQVAEEIEMHESTISRVTTNKYMHTPQGIFELKYFFHSGISRGEEFGGEMSSESVREIIRKMIIEEDSIHPLKDQEIVERLNSQHIQLARRTVAKYRSELRIPQANRRKYSG